MPPKGKGKDKDNKGGGKGKKPPAVDLTKAMKDKDKEKLKPKKIPPPPACFTPVDLIRFKEIFKLYDESGMDKLINDPLFNTTGPQCGLVEYNDCHLVMTTGTDGFACYSKYDPNDKHIPLAVIPELLRKLGFNPKTAEINEMFKLFLEDDLVDMVEFHELLFMIEAKKSWGDDFDPEVTKAMAALGHDDEEETGLCVFDTLREELFTWGEPFTDLEFADWGRLAIKEKTFVVETGQFNYVKFIENMNAKDVKALPEPINFFKLDQKTLAELAIKKAEEEKVEQERKEAERKAREDAKRQKMIDDGLLPPDYTGPI